MSKYIKLINKDVNSFIKTYEQDEKVIKKVLELLTVAYEDGKPLVNDENYDLLKNLWPEGIRDEIESDKVLLPYLMGSLNKCKTSKEIEQFEALCTNKQKNNVSYVVLDKLDGVSALLYKKGLYTRGNGLTGENISHLIDLIPGFNELADAAKKQKICVRGELIIKEKDIPVIEKLEKNFTNLRSAVAGVVNKKAENIENNKIFNYVNFVSYQIVNSDETHQEQLKILESIGFNVAPYNIIPRNLDLVDFEYEDYIKYIKNDTEYDVDGIVVSNNEVSLHVEKLDEETYKDIPKSQFNPKFEIALKTVNYSTIEQSTVVDVEWNVSQNMLLKPVLIIIPVSISNTTVKRVTGNNAEYLQQNGIGIGTKIEIIKSGDVIPKIHSVVSLENNFKIPIIDGHDVLWNETEKELFVQKESIVNNKNDEISSIVAQKILENEIKTILGVNGVGEEMLKKFVDIGITKLHELTTETIAKLNAKMLKQESVTKFLENLETTLKEANLHQLFSLYPKFDKLSSRKFEILFNGNQELFEYALNVIENSDETLINDEIDVYNAVLDVKGFGEQNAKSVGNNFNKALKYVLKVLKQNNVVFKHVENEKQEINKNNRFYKQKIVFSGFRNKDLEKEIEDEGGVVEEHVGNKTTMLIFKSKNTEKYQQAEQENIKLVNYEDIFE